MVYAWAVGELQLRRFVIAEENSGRGREGGAEDELVKRCQEGDTEAFGELVRRYEGRIYSIVYHYVRNPEDAVDITREVFIKAFNSIKRFRGTAKLSSWLCRIAINQSIDFVRRKRTVRFESLEGGQAGPEGEGPGERDFPDPGRTPEEAVVGEELAQRIARAVDKLSEKLRTVIILREYEGMSIEEIAEVLGCSQGTVKSRIFRARERLRRMLEPYIEG